MIQGLRTIIDKVPDLEVARAWYARALGFEPYFAEPFYVGFRVGAFELGLDPDLEEGGGPGEGMVAYRGVADPAADPFGNVFGIVPNPHFSLAEVR